MKDNTFAFFVLTEYQLLCAVEFVWNDVEKARNHSTLFLSKSITGFNEITKELNKYKLFSEIILVDRIVFNRSRVKRKLESMRRILNPGIFGKYISGRGLKKGTVKYSIIVVASGSLEFEMFRNYFPHDFLYYIEDGIGSYTGRAKSGNISKSRRLIQKILGRDEPVTKMYLHLPELCNHKEAMEVCAVPDYRRNDFWKFVREVFGTKKDDVLYHDDDAVYIEQPMIGLGLASDELDKKIQRLCADSFGESICIRNHPRDRGKKSVISRSDDRALLWELICHTEINNSNILIGYYSTAQITPKILFNKEPYIVFLYKLYPISVELKQKLDNTVALLSKAYSDSSKIYIPDTIERFSQVLDELKHVEKEK